MVKYTKREMYLMIALIVLIAAFSFYKLVLIKQDAKVDKLKSQNSSLELQVNSIKSHIFLKDKITSDVKILKAKAENKGERFFPSITQEKIIILLNNIIKKSEINVNSISFSEIVTAPIQNNAKDSQNGALNNKKTQNNPLNTLVNEYNGDQAQSKSKQNLNNSAVSSKYTADNMEVSLGFNGNFSSLMSLIENIEGFSKKIIIKNIDIGSGQGDVVAGTITLDFYAIPKLNPEDENYLAWTLDGNYGKDNPFYSAGTTSQAAASKSQDFDFLMDARPISSDLPTIMIGKAKDSAKDTYVYADNAGVENVEICFIKNGDKYYFKYKTSGDSYPVQYGSDGTEFLPLGDSINIKIYSIKRNSTSDMSGANIKIINKTDKAVNAVIDGDDTDRPRINISGDGNVSVKNEK